MISWLVSLLLPHVGARFAKPLAWAIVIVIAVLLFLTAKSIYDRSVVDDWIDDSNEQFEEDQDKAQQDADGESDERREDHEERVKTTKELIDEAIENDCAVGEYLASGGTRCVRP